MTIYNFIKDVISILKKEKLLIGITTILIVAIFGALKMFSPYGSLNEINEENQRISDEAAGFNMFIEENEGTFTNSYLLEILIKDEAVLNEIENETGVDVKTPLEDFANGNEPIYTEEDPINIERNRSSNLMMVTVSIGSKQDNKDIANAIYDWFDKQNNPFFDNKNIYFVDDPATLIKEDDQIKTDQSSSIFTSPLFYIQLLLSIIVGIFVGIFIAIMKTLLDSKIRYSFAYGWDSEDTYIRLTDQSTSEELTDVLYKTNQKTLVIVFENEIEANIKKRLENYSGKTILIIQTLKEVPAEYNPGEITLLIKRGETSKAWYREQRQLMKIYKHAEIKIVEK